MPQIRRLSPERLVRSDASFRLTALQKHFARLSAFPHGVEQNKNLKVGILRTLRKKEDCFKALAKETTTMGELRLPFYDVSGALQQSVDVYIREANKFAESFGGSMLLDVIHLVEPVYKDELKRRNRYVRAYENLDHETLTEELASLQGQLDTSEWRARVARSKAVSREARERQRQIRTSIRELLKRPSWLEYQVEIAGCVVARLGLFIRKLKAKLKSQPTACRSRAAEVELGQTVEMDDLRRNYLRKLKKTKRVSFHEESTLVLFDGLTRVKSSQPLREETEVRRRPTFKRSSDSYQQGKWADFSGAGFIDTSGYTLDEAEWQSSCEDVWPLHESTVEEEPLSPLTVGDSRLQYWDRPDDSAGEDTERWHTSQTPPCSPQIGSCVWNNLAFAQIEDYGLSSRLPSAYGEYRRLSEEEERVDAKPHGSQRKESVGDKMRRLSGAGMRVTWI